MRSEVMKHRDMLVEPFRDAYLNITLKGLFVLKYFLNFNERLN